MKIFSSQALKIAASLAILVSSAAYAETCYQACQRVATQSATQARAAYISQNLPGCDQYKADPTAYNTCVANLNTAANNYYQSVYQQAITRCQGSCSVVGG